MEIVKIPNQVFMGSLKPLNLNRVDSIALHHMAHPTADVKTVEGWHINQGWSAFGYNFWVGFDGTIYEGRGFNTGAGVANQNHHIVSIGFQGDYHNVPVHMPDEQFNSGVDIIRYVLEKIPHIKEIGGHRNFMSTACPGQYFPLEEMKNLIKRGSDEMVYYDWTEACPDWAQKYVHKALETGYIKGDEQGRLRLTDDRIWCLVVMLRINGIME